MRARSPLRVLVLLLGVSLLPVLTVSAHHNPQVADVVAVAEAKPWVMKCLPGSGTQVCSPTGRLNLSRLATIAPKGGPLASVTTRVNAVITQGPNGPVYSMDPNDQMWNVALHNVGCADTNGVTKFMADLGGDSDKAKVVGPTTVGECTMVGSLLTPTATTNLPPPPYYQVTNRTLPSAFTPTPTPTLKPTPRPTARPTPTPTPSPTATPTPTATPSPTATPPLNTPEQSVLAVVFTPQPSRAPPAPAPAGGGGGGGGNGWAGSVASANQVSTDGVKLAGSAIAALLLLLAMGFIGELFNDTFEGNYDRILAWWQKSWLGKVGKAFGGLWGGGK